MVYLDNAATTPLNKEVFNTYISVLEKYYGNPDSIHNVGFEAHRLVENSRDTILKLLNLSNHQLIFTSGASEANNLAIKGVALANAHKGKHIITTNIEHASVMNACLQLERLHGFEVTYLPVDKDGVVCVQQVLSALRNDTILVSIMCVNNEIGSINPINEIGEMLKQRNIVFHSDLVQAIGKIPLNLKYVDMGTISAHKIHGLKGSGALFMRKGIKLEPLICGGAQEYNLRGGTNNAPVNIVLAKTLRIAFENQVNSYKKAMEIKKYLYDDLKDIVDFNDTLSGSPFIISITTSIGSEIMMNALQQVGFLVSARSTCASKYTKASHVLLAIGLSEEKANKTIRVSLQNVNTLDEMRAFSKSVKEIIIKYSK